jgi:uncharacterized RDD family membrane protein YckC
MMSDKDDDLRPSWIEPSGEGARGGPGQEGFLPPSWATPGAGAGGPAPIPELAAYRWRAAGFLIDGVLLYVVLGAVLGPLSSNALVLGCVAVAARVAYATVLLTYWKGATVGMRLMRLTCVDATTLAPVASRQAFVRALVAELIAAASMIAAILSVLQVGDLLWPIWDPRNQTVHDKAGGTVVLRRAVVVAR